MSSILARRALVSFSGLTAVGFVLAGCAIGPNYSRPAVTTTPAFKEADGWMKATPGDLSDRGDWWTLFNDPVLNDLEAKVAVSNQNLAAAEAAYRESAALLDEARATILPTVTLTPTATRAKSASATVVSPTTGLSSTTRSVTANTYTAKLGATWDIDLWGRIRRQIEAAHDNTEAQKADIANAKLSAQVLLAVDYVQLRAADEQKRLLNDTIKAYSDNLRIVQNKFNVGVAQRSDVLTAQTTLKTAQAQAIDLGRTRAQYEHAIAVLTGQPPAQFALAATPWTLKSPNVPLGVPSALLQRRPDVAAAERTMAAANAQIGVAYAGFFPDLSLTGSDGFTSSALQRFFTAATNTWSLGATATQTVFDAGSTFAKIRYARAAYEQNVANYRQTVLTAMQQVEDNIAAARVLDAEYDYQASASKDADDAEKITNNQYVAGTVDFTTVVVSENTALAARRTLIQTDSARLVAVVDLISALGGGWSQEQLAQK